MDDNADAKKILLASPLADWRRQPGCPRTTWLSTVHQDLRHHHLMLPKAADMAQNQCMTLETTTTSTKTFWQCVRQLKSQFWYLLFQMRDFAINIRV